MENLNSVSLILAVESQPAVWDTDFSDYKIKQKKVDAWTAICEDVVENFADIQDDRTKNDICKKVQLKWKSMRDSFRKDHCAYVQAPSGSKKRKYVYSNKMQFLLKMIEGTETESNITQPNSGEQEDSDNPSRPRVFKKAKKQKSVDRHIVEHLNKQDKVESDDTGLFFQSLLSSVKDFTEDEKLQLKGGVISLITNIRRERNNYSQNNVFQRPGATKYCSYNAADNTAAQLQSMQTSSFTDHNSSPPSVSSVSSDGTLIDNFN